MRSHRSSPCWAGIRYAFVEQVLDVPNNRSNAALTGAFRFTRRLSARATLLWQHTHGGLRVPADLATPEHFREHDRILRDNNWRLGAGVSYSWSRFDAFASCIQVHGRSEHACRARVHRRRQLAVRAPLIDAARMPSARTWKAELGIPGLGLEDTTGRPGDPPAGPFHLRRFWLLAS